MKIGWALTCAVAVSILAAASEARAASCFIKDKDIADEFTGPCVDGKAHGVGTARGRDVYVGNFERGVKQGKGRYVWGETSTEPGSVYDGEWRDDRRTGKGKYVWGRTTEAPGSSYDGEWRDSSMNGRGVKKFSPENVRKCVEKYSESRCVVRYEGVFKDGKLFNGKEVLVSGAVNTYVDGKSTAAVSLTPGAQKALDFIGILAGTKEVPSSGSSSGRSNGGLVDIVSVSCQSSGYNGDHKLYLGGRSEIVSGDNGKFSNVSVYTGRYGQPVDLTYNCSWSAGGGQRKSCSGSLHVSGQKRNITINASSVNCSYTNTHEY